MKCGAGAGAAGTKRTTPHPYLPRQPPTLKQPSATTATASAAAQSVLLLLGWQ
jgi:hypothetical protein